MLRTAGDPFPCQRRETRFARQGTHSLPEEGNMLRMAGDPFPTKGGDMLRMAGDPWTIECFGT